MLLALANWIASDVRAFSVFGYITLRGVLATMTALVISFVVGPSMIRKLTQYKIGQAVRDDGPQSHLIKAGTPTMGGALILVSIAITTLLWADLRNRFVWVVLLVTLGFGAVGWVDDWRKVVHRNPKGLSARAKYFWQSLIGVAAAVYLGMTATLPARRMPNSAATKSTPSGSATITRSSGRTSSAASRCANCADRRCTSAYEKVRASVRMAMRSPRPSATRASSR